MRDINTVNGYCGAYCYHDPQTDMAFNFGEAIIQRVQNYDWKSLETYYHDIIPSQSDLEKEIPENLMSPPILTKDYNFVIFAYGGVEGDDTWLHYKVNRMPHNNDCWVMECSIVYYVGDKSYRETQYAVLLPGKSISILYEGDHHTFKFKIPKNEQGGIIETHTIAYYCFQKM